jgi:hypothetical protein
MSKADQRRRRRAGYEVFPATIFKPRFIPWLIWEGVLDEAALREERDRSRQREMVIEAMETYLMARYMLPEIEGEPMPRYATDQPWEEMAALRNRPPATQLMEFGVLELDRPRWQRRPNPTPYLITARTAAIRRAADNIPDPEDYFDAPVWATVPFRDSVSEDVRVAVSDYDPEDDGEEESRDLQEMGTEQAFAEDEAN